MKYHSLWKLNNILRISNFQSQIKHASSTAQKLKKEYQNEPPQTKEKQKKKAIFIPELPRSKLESLNDVTSVVVSLNHVSWAKISVDLNVVNWNAYSLPNYLSNDITDTDILENAHAVGKQIPSSDLYVMEHKPSSKWMLSINDICLRSMVILLLHASAHSEKVPKIIFQNPIVMNNVLELTVGRERISAKQILQRENILEVKSCREKISIGELMHGNKNVSKSVYSLISLQSEQLECFYSSPREKQESLSIALLLGLTFLDVGVLQNEKSISKLSKKKETPII